MPIQLDSQIFKWIQSLGLIKQGKRNQNNLIEVTEQFEGKLFDGFLIGILIRNVLKSKGDQQKIKKIQALKDNNTPAIRLYNWNILTEVLKQLKYNLEYGQKSKIINYEAEPISKILSYLIELKKNDPNQKEELHNSLKLDINEIGKKTIRDASNVLQFITISISKNFKLSPQQTLNLYLDNNKYLSHLLVKGVKNSYEPIYLLLNEIKSQVDFIVVTLFCIDEEDNVNFLLNALKSCFISKNFQTAFICSQIFLEIYDNYKINNLSPQCVRDWLKNQGINTLFFGLKKYQMLTQNILKIGYSFLDDQFFKYLQLTQKSILWTSERQKFYFYQTFLVNVSKQIFNKFSITNYFQQWNKFLIKSMKKSKQKQEILFIITIMQEQWNKLGTKFESNQLSLPNLFINFLTNMNTSSNELLFIQSTRTLFSLMQSLGQIKNLYAPIIYKLLIGNFSTLSVNSKIVFMADNFNLSFKTISSLPGGPLVSALLKHIQSNIQIPLIELLKTILQENRISQNQIVDLFEMLTKSIYQDISYGGIAIQFIFQNLNYLDSTFLQEYLENHCKLCLSQLYSTSKIINKTIKQLKQQANKYLQVKNQQQNKLLENYLSMVSKHIICGNLVKFISKAVFQNGHIKQVLQSPIFTTYIKIKVQIKKVEQAEILKNIMLSYYDDEDQLNNRIEYYHKLLFPPKPVQQKSKDHNHNHLSKSVTILTEAAPPKDIFQIDASTLKPSSFAIKDLQKAKQKRYQIKTIEQQRQKQKQKKQQKIQKFRTIMYEKRLIESMATINKDVEYKSLIMTIQPKKEAQIQINNNISGVPLIKLINFESQEEPSYYEDILSIMKKFKKVWRYLFYKYSNKKFEQNSEEKAHMGDVWKMFKEYDFNYLKKQECFTIVRLVNQNSKRKNDIQNLTYNCFEEFILQSIAYAYNRPNLYPHVPVGQQVLIFIQHLKQITKERGGSIQIFDNPQEAYFQQTQVIRQYNNRLKQNPDYILPEGYKKIKQTTLEYEYNYHPMLQKNISSSYIDVLQVLDSIFSERPQLKFRLIEPLTIKNQKYLAKPVLFQNITQNMKYYTKGYLEQKRSVSATNNELKKQISPPITSKKIFKPYINFSLGIKLGIAETSLKHKSIAEQVAYCMNDILDAIENQSPIVKNRGKKKVVNQFLKRKRMESIKIQNEKKNDEVNWKKRAESVKLEVEVLREKRKEAEKAKKKNQYLMKKIKKQKQQKLQKQKIAQFQRIKVKIAQKKQALLELKAIEDQKIKSQKQEYKQGVQQYFRKKKQQIRQKQQEYKRKKVQEKQKKEQAEQNKKQLVKKVYYNNLKKEQLVVEKIDEIKQTYDDTWKSNQIQDVILQNKKSLKYLFDLLLKYQKSKISATNYDQIGLNTLNFFCVKFKIIPFMLEKNDLNKIFIYATNVVQDQKKTSRRGINFDKFEQIIFLIAIKAKKMLNNITEKKKKKQKKLQALLNSQKANSGNHFEPAEIQESSSQSSEDEIQNQKPTLQDQYLFNAEGVSEDTMKQVFNFLKLPKDKQGVQERYREAMETKNAKPKNILIKQLKATLED